ncbi:MAG: hypothetical protein AAGU15_09025 [Anaerolineaceae bacterium]
MRISDLLNATKPLAIKFVSGDAAIILNIEYRTNAVTYSVLKSWVGLDSWESVMRQIEVYVAKWDLTDDEGAMIPLTEKSLVENNVPLALINVILMAIQTDIQENRETKND